MSECRDKTYTNVLFISLKKVEGFQCEILRANCITIFDISYYSHTSLCPCMLIDKFNNDCIHMLRYSVAKRIFIHQ